MVVQIGVFVTKSESPVIKLGTRNCSVLTVNAPDTVEVLATESLIVVVEPFFIAGKSVTIALGAIPVPAICEPGRIVYVPVSVNVVEFLTPITFPAGIT